MKKESRKRRSRPTRAGLANGVCSASGLAQVGVDEGCLLGGEEALALQVAGGEELGVERLAIDDHLHEVAHGIVRRAQGEILEGQFGLG